MKKEYILVLQPGTDKSEFEELLAKHNINVKIDWDGLKRHYTIEFDDSKKKYVKAEPCVYHVTEADAPVRLMETQRIEVSGSGYGGNWGLTRICKRDNWNNNTWYPNSGTYTFFRTGEGVDIYVVDTGARMTHQDFGDRIYPLYDHYRNSTDPRFCWDDQGHGTHVASTAAGAKYGVAKKARIYVSRVFETGGATLSAIIAGINACLNHHRSKTDNRASVMNLSLGGPAHWIEEQAINDCINSGIVCVAAAGNDGKNLDEAGYDVMPAEIDRAITVGSVNIRDEISSFSNYGHMVDVFAPGHYITAASYKGDTAELMLSGTSMASPHVAGICALKLENYGKTYNSQQVMEVHDWIRDNATSNTLVLTEAVRQAQTANRMAYSDFVEAETQPVPEQNLNEVSRNTSETVTTKIDRSEPVVETTYQDRTEKVNNTDGTVTTKIIRTITTTTTVTITITDTVIATTVIYYSNGTTSTEISDPVVTVRTEYDVQTDTREEVLSEETIQQKGKWWKKDRSNWITGRNWRMMDLVIRHLGVIERLYDRFVVDDDAAEIALRDLEIAAEKLAMSGKFDRVSSYYEYVEKRDSAVSIIRETWKTKRRK